MTYLKFILIISITIVLFSSCNQRLVGTWNVKKYETITPGQEGTAAENIGTVTFERNGKGKKELEFTIMGMTQKDVAPFKWFATDEYVTIDGRKSNLSKTWIIMKNKLKSQTWQSTDGANEVQKLVLQKQ